MTEMIFVVTIVIVLALAWMQHRDLQRALERIDELERDMDSLIRDRGTEYDPGRGLDLSTL